MSARREYTYDRNRAPVPVETPEPEPVRCECPSIDVGDSYKTRLLQQHTRSCVGINDLDAVPVLVPCDVCGGPAPCAPCAAWSMPALGTALVYTLRPLDARPVKTFKGIVTRIDAAEDGWNAGIVVTYPKLKFKGMLNTAVFHEWPHVNLTVTL